MGLRESGKRYQIVRKGSSEKRRILTVIQDSLPERICTGLVVRQVHVEQQPLRLAQGLDVAQEVADFVLGIGSERKIS